MKKKLVITYKNHITYIKRGISRVYVYEGLKIKKKFLLNNNNTLQYEPQIEDV